MTPIRDRFPGPWQVQQIAGGFQVLDTAGTPLAYVYAPPESARRSQSRPFVIFPVHRKTLETQYCLIGLCILLSRETALGNKPFCSLWEQGVASSNLVAPTN